MIAETRLHIALVTPAPARSRAGNRTTAVRWRDLLQGLGHRVDVSTGYDGADADLMLALHAWRSSEAIAAFAERYPERPLIVAITGTDAYRFIHSHPEPTLRSIRLADRLVGLHDLIAETLPEEERWKMHVIHQSAEPVGARVPYQRFFHVSVIGHLRDEKDPLRPAIAARLLPESSRIQIHQYGKAHTPEWAAMANAEIAENGRYRWHGELPRHRIRQVYRRTNLLVLPSLMEGGANVISEAAVAGIPVIASRIPGSVGLLGDKYPGFYPVSDETGLAELMHRCENDTAFYQTLASRCRAMRTRFAPAVEAAAWRNLLAEIGRPSGNRR